ncbi:MAG: M61 family metallopeptidase [Chthonomonadales bacterium]|nr:M61 family metallopeptidase [Chthonomonadales bacterium]
MRPAVPPPRTCGACLVLLCLALGPARALRTAYTLTPAPPAGADAASTHVRITLDDLRGDPVVRVRMPVWSPGDYSVQRHARWVRGLRATAPGAGALPVTRVDADTWQIDTAGRAAVRIAYELPNSPAGNFSENVRVTRFHAFYDGPATFAYVVGHTAEPLTLEVRRPAGWPSVVSPLPRAPSATDAPEGVVRLAARDYDTLADSPLLVGHCVERRFEAAGRPHLVAFFGNHEGENYDAIAATFQRVAEAENAIMGGPPYARYVLFLDYDGVPGGLEHGSSARIGWSVGRRSLPAFAALVAHEFFHLWNVKRIRPAGLGPFDYIHPPRTPNLWFSEGVTEYYAGRTLLRAGLASRDRYLAALAGSIAAYRRNPARLRVSADESSLRVWETTTSEGYGGLSYYQKGEMIGLCLDLSIRHASGGRRSMDDVMRDLLRRAAPPAPGFAPDGIREAVIRAGGPAMGPLYDLLARSTREAPFAECLGYAGLRLRSAGGRPRIEPDPAADPAATTLREGWLSAGAPGG